MARIVLKHVSKIFPGPRHSRITALADLNVTIDRGEFVAIVGPSGSGKSTLLRLIAGLDTVTSGEIVFDDRVVNEVPAAERDVAMVFQDHALFPHLTVRENLSLGLKLRHVPRPEIEQRITEAAAMLGLPTLLERRPNELSGGERQRVAFGRAVVRQPAVFLFDEPLSQLEPALRWELRRQLATLQERLGTTTVYVTHDQEEAMMLGRRMVVLHRGAVQQEGEPLRIYHQPTNLFVATLLGSPPMNFIFGDIVLQGNAPVFIPKGKAESPSDALDAPWVVPGHLRKFAGHSATLGIRPHHLSISARESSPRGAGLTAIVESLQLLGADTYVYLRAQGVHLTVREAGQAHFVPQQVVNVHVQLEHACLFEAATGLALPRKGN